MNNNHPTAGMVAAARVHRPDPTAPMRRRYQQVCAALARCEDHFAEIERELAHLGRKATRLRSERETLREILDRKGAR